MSNMRVHHLDCGTMRPVGGRLVDGEPGVFRAATLVCHCLLLETDDGLVLVDSGLGTQDVADPVRSLGKRFVRLARPELDVAQTAVRQVVRLGYAVEDVRHIVLTHLDLDHAGGLPDFPKATVHVLAAEHRAAMAPGTSLERERYRRHQWAHGPDWRLYEDAGDPWFGFEAVRQLAGLPPEVLLIPLAGHTRGHTGVAVDTGDGWLLHGGDAYFVKSEVDPAKPRSTPILGLFQRIMQVDGRPRVANQRRLVELARAHGDEVSLISAHSLAELRDHATVADRS